MTDTKTTIDANTTYSVRRPGCTAWREDIATIEEAERECEIANRTCARGHIVVLDTDSEAAGDWAD